MGRGVWLKEQRAKRAFFCFGALWVFSSFFFILPFFFIYSHTWINSFFSEYGNYQHLLWTSGLTLTFRYDNQPELGIRQLTRSGKRIVAPKGVKDSGDWSPSSPHLSKISPISPILSKAISNSPETRGDSGILRPSLAVRRRSILFRLVGNLHCNLPCIYRSMSLGRLDTLGYKSWWSQIT